MDEATRTDAASFDAIAEQYDAHRPGYPEELIELACRRAGLVRGDRVLEIGAGTGKLTAGLLARGLDVTAVEPGRRLAGFLTAKLGGAGALSVEVARLEDVELAPRSFAAAFSASAFHWIDPEVSWARVAELLAPGAMFSLLQHFAVDEPVQGLDQDLLVDTIGRFAPEWAARWHEPRTPDQTLAGARARRGNVSELWSWLGGYDLARAAAGQLFGQAEIDARPVVLESTAAQLNAVLRTMSFHSRLSAGQIAAIDAANLAHEQAVGRPLRVVQLAVLVTARVAG